jgi:arginase
MDDAAQVTFGLLGVPSSAGSHNAGQDKAPEAWRSAGLPERLGAAGLRVRDFGDLPVRRHRPAARVDGVRDLDRVLEVARQTADRVDTIAGAGCVALVVGGDCTITLGVLAGLSRHAGVGLVYFDGDVDLNVPESSGSGVLDTMGMTHALGGGNPELSSLGQQWPMLADDHVVLFGFDPAELDTDQWTSLASHHLYAVPAPSVRQDPSRKAVEALSYLESRVERVLVHLDVDVLDTGAFPLANFPHFAGLPLAEVAACLEVFCASPKFAGLIVTEVNPDHDPDAVLLSQLLEVLVQALLGVPGQRVGASRKS